MYSLASQSYISFYLFMWREGRERLAAGSTVWSQIDCVVKDDLELNARSSSHSLKSGVTGLYDLTQFMWCWELNPQIQACCASTLLTELHRLDLKGKKAKIKIQASNSNKLQRESVALLPFAFLSPPPGPPVTVISK